MLTPMYRQQLTHMTSTYTGQVALHPQGRQLQPQTRAEVYPNIYDNDHISSAALTGISSYIFRQQAYDRWNTTHDLCTIELF
jgi:hypothetical protein